jgi:hypothetical protein
MPDRLGESPCVLLGSGDFRPGADASSNALAALVSWRAANAIAG